MCVCVYTHIRICVFHTLKLCTCVCAQAHLLLQVSENSVTRLLGELVFRDVSQKRFAVIISEHFVAEQGVYIAGKLLPPGVYVNILIFEFHKIQSTDIQHCSSVSFILNWKQLP